MRIAPLAVVLLSACSTPATNMRVLVSPPSYATELSSTIGLGLTPVTESPPGVVVRCRWTADGGFLLRQEAGASEITDLDGTAVIEGCERLFWSYDSGEQSVLARRGVAISVTAENAGNGRVLARTDMKLAWDGQSFRVAR